MTTRRPIVRLDLGLLGELPSADTLPMSAIPTESGSYVPVMYDGPNLQWVEASLEYSRIGGLVWVWGQCTASVNPDGGYGRLSLPVPSNFSSSLDAIGVGFFTGRPDEDVIQIYGDPATNRLHVQVVRWPSSPYIEEASILILAMYRVK